jgi:hypothetical protein
LFRKGPDVPVTIRALVRVFVYVHDLSWNKNTWNTLTAFRESGRNNAAVGKIKIR